MKILFLTENFPPESNAPANRTFEHAREWVKAGHQVTIVTSAPNYPEGKLFPGYKNSWYQVGNREGIRVVRVKTYMAANSGFGRRILDQLSYLVMGFVGGLFQRRPDVVIGTSPQFFTVCAAWAVAFVKRKPFVFELRDFWPASIVAVGAMRQGLAVRLLTVIEQFLYRQAALIICVTQAYKEKLISRGIAPGKIVVAINGVDLTLFQARAKDEELQAKLKFKDKFVVAYIGTHGMAHRLDLVLEAADKLRHKPEIVFLLIGSGSCHQELHTTARLLELSNILILPRQARETIPRYWSICDLALVPLRNNPLFATVIPSKMFESMSMGVPIIISVPEGEATRVIRQTGTGIVIEPENPDMLAEAVQLLQTDHEHLSKLGEQGIKQAARFSRNEQAQRMLLALEHLVSEESIDMEKKFDAPY